MILQAPYSVENLQCVTFINHVIDPEESYLRIGIGKKRAAPTDDYRQEKIDLVGLFRSLMHQMENPYRKFVQ